MDSQNQKVMEVWFEEKER